MTERPNKELAFWYWSDPTLEAWWWDKDVCVWRTAAEAVTLAASEIGRAMG